MAGDTPSPEEKVQTTVYITREQKEWLAENDEINLSGFVRRKLDEIRGEDIWELDSLLGPRKVGAEDVKEIENALNGDRAGDSE